MAGVHHSVLIHTMMAIAPAKPLPAFWRWVALAAVIPIFLAVAALNKASLASTVVVGSDGSLEAGAEIGGALKSATAATTEFGPVWIGITFRNQSNHICRTWAMMTRAGIACYAGYRWKITAMFDLPADNPENPQIVAIDGPLMKASVAAIIKGAPMDAAEEKRTMIAGWDAFPPK